MEEELIKPQCDNSFNDVVRKIKDYRESHGLPVNNPSGNYHGK